MSDLTRQEVVDVLDYEPETGIFRWAVTRAGWMQAGRVAGCLNGNGYLHISINKSLYKAHRLAWLLTSGEWPANQVDHINGVRDDNRIANLRLATNVENSQNRCVHRNNTSGAAGVSRESGKWRARIRAGGKRISLGLFDSPEAAATAYLDAKAQLHSFSPMGQPKPKRGRR